MHFWADRIKFFT